MKKESVNTFSDGLNYDLNPLSTPNTLLTDNVNGTFITFNGDELALQNDAGNTKISVPYTNVPNYNPVGNYEVGNIVKSGESYYKNLTGLNRSLNEDFLDVTYVQLTPGFLPLGIKEYGGVLYIVSGKDFDKNLRPLVINNIYTVNEIVLSNNNYYKCIKDTKLITSDDLANTDIWYNLSTNISSDIEVIKAKYNELEFGSYPGPEDANYGENLVGNSINLTEEKLYKMTKVSNSIFKAGRYVTFNLDQFSIPDMYVVKLYLQLESGVLDLTEDVKAKLGSEWWKSSTPYYCPWLFKGFLNIRLEIKPPSGYRASAPIVSLDPLDNSQVKITVDIYDAKIAFSAYESEVNGNGPVYTYKLDNTTLNYKIYPILGNVDYLDYPPEFLDQYELRGSINLYKPELELGLNILASECDEGVTKVKVWEIVNAFGPITTVDNGVPKGWIMVAYDYDFIDKNKYWLIGNFDAGSNNFTSFNAHDGAGTSTIYKNAITELASKTLCVFNNQQCNNLPILFDFSVPISMTAPTAVYDGNLFIYQDQDITALPYNSADLGKTFEVFAQRGRTLFIQFMNESFGTNIISISGDALAASDTYHIGFKLEFEPLIWNANLTKYLTFRTIPIPRRHLPLLEHIASQGYVQRSASYTATPPWRTSNTGTFSAISDGDWCYLELELEYIGEGLGFPVPISRTNQYYVDIISNIGLQPNPKEALNITNIADYTQFKFQSDSLFIKKKTALSVYPTTRSSRSGSRTTYTR